MAQALLSTAKPVRLTRNEDGWALDVEQLVRVESSLFRPTVTTVWAHLVKGREVSLVAMAAAPWNFSPSKESMEPSWYNPTSAARLVSNVR